MPKPVPFANIDRHVTMLAGFVFLGAFVASAWGAAIPGANSAVRWCTASDAEQAKCLAMKTAIDSEDGANVALQCEQRPTSGSCFWEVGQGSQDVTSAGFRHSYSAGKAYGLIPIVGEVYSQDPNSDPYFYKSLAVIHRNNTKINSLEDLRGAKSCHTVVYKNAGWAIPMSLLNEKGLLSGDDCLDNVENVANLFSQSCAANSQKATYNYLGKDLSSMCSLCVGDQETKCTEKDPYSGYIGSFKCLQDSRGDIAFTKNGIPEEATNGETQEGRRLQDFVLLCPDGTRKEIQEYDQCNWGSVTPRGVMVSPHLNSRARQDFKSYLLNTGDSIGNFKLFESNSFGGKNLMFSDRAISLYDPKTEDYKVFTGPSYVRTMENQTIQCDSTVPSTLRWCVVTPPEISKCHQMTVAFEFWFVKPRVQCVVADSQRGCMAKIRDGSADLVTLDGGEIYTGGKEYNLMPIMFENYGKNDSKYWSVAVVKKSDQTVTFTNLRGKKSCHTGVGRTAGWDVPIATLIKSGQIQVTDKCDVVNDVAKFFDESCAPGAQDPAFHQANGTQNSANLCELCKGEGQNKCARNTNEPYFGYTGAFRCLAEGGGDVAFVNHITALENTDGKNQDSWAKELKSEDFELICKDGSRQPVDKYQECNLAKVPAHSVVTASSKTEKEINAFIHALQKGQELYADDTNPAFRMFDSGVGSKDILFRDATVGLEKIIPNQRNYRDYLGEFLDTAEFLDNGCNQNV